MNFAQFLMPCGLARENGRPAQVSPVPVSSRCSPTGARRRGSWSVPAGGSPPGWVAAGTGEPEGHGPFGRWTSSAWGLRSPAPAVDSGHRNRGTRPPLGLHRGPGTGVRVHVPGGDESPVRVHAPDHPAVAALGAQSFVGAGFINFLEARCRGSRRIGAFSVPWFATPGTPCCRRSCESIFEIPVSTHLPTCPPQG